MIKKITTYRIELEDGYYCDITEKSTDEYDFWLYHKDYCTAIYMFGVKANTQEELIELAVSNAPDYYDSLEIE